jgi:hypoxanthine phosphoribosyltransferase
MMSPATPPHPLQTGSVLFREDEILARIKALATEICGAYPDGTELTVIALLNGSLIFAADLIRQLPMATRLESLAVASYYGGKKSAGTVTFKQTVPDLTGRTVLILDDILDTGRTLGAVIAKARQSGAETVRSCVLLSKRRAREVDVAVDHIGFEIDDLFVVGYGLDFEGRLRNLPYIAVLDEPGEKSA